MANTAKIDSLVVHMNRMIEDHHRQISLNQVPDFKELENRMHSFEAEIAHLSGTEARKYTEILRIWVDSIRQMTKALEHYKQEIQDKLSDYQNHSGAINAYKRNDS